MIGECTSLYYLHWLKLLKSGFLCNLVLTLISIMLKMSHVCDVADITYLVAKVLEEFHEYIVCHTWPCMTKMRVAIYGRTADIKSHVSLVNRLENLFLSRKRIGDI
jgi:hypothetical protein